MCQEVKLLYNYLGGERRLYFLYSERIDSITKTKICMYSLWFSKHFSFAM